MYIYIYVCIYICIYIYVQHTATHCKKNVPQARFFKGKNAQRLIKKKAPQARIFDQVLMGTMSY